MQRLNRFFREGSEGKEEGGEADPPSHLTCNLCLDVLVDPVTVACGHSFCDICFDRLGESRRASRSLECPCCREPLEWGKPGVSVALAQDIRAKFPQSVEARRAKHRSTSRPSAMPRLRSRSPAPRAAALPHAAATSVWFHPAELVSGPVSRLPSLVSIAILSTSMLPSSALFNVQHLWAGANHPALWSPNVTTTFLAANNVTVEQWAAAGASPTAPYAGLRIAAEAWGFAAPTLAFVVAATMATKPRSTLAVLALCFRPTLDAFFSVLHTATASPSFPTPALVAATALIPEVVLFAAVFAVFVALGTWNVLTALVAFEMAQAALSSWPHLWAARLRCFHHDLTKVFGQPATAPPLPPLRSTTVLGVASATLSLELCMLRRLLACVVGGCAVLAVATPACIRFQATGTLWVTVAILAMTTFCVARTPMDVTLSHVAAMARPCVAAATLGALAAWVPPTVVSHFSVQSASDPAATASWLESFTGVWIAALAFGGVEVVLALLPWRAPGQVFYVHTLALCGAMRAAMRGTPPFPWLGANGALLVADVALASVASEQW